MKELCIIIWLGRFRQFLQSLDESKFNLHTPQHGGRAGGLWNYSVHWPLLGFIFVSISEHLEHLGIFKTCLVKRTTSGCLTDYLNFFLVRNLFKASKPFFQIIFFFFCANLYNLNLEKLDMDLSGVFRIWILVRQKMQKICVFKFKHLLIKVKNQLRDTAKCVK